MSERQAPPTPALPPAEDLHQAMEWPACLPREELTAPQRQRWQQLEALHQGWQRTTDVQRRDSLAQAYRVQRQAFVADICH